MDWPPYAAQHTILPSRSHEHRFIYRTAQTFHTLFHTSFRVGKETLHSTRSSLRSNSRRIRHVAHDNANTGKRRFRGIGTNQHHTVKSVVALHFAEDAAQIAVASVEHLAVGQRGQIVELLRIRVAEHDGENRNALAVGRILLLELVKLRRVRLPVGQQRDRTV